MTGERDWFEKAGDYKLYPVITSLETMATTNQRGQ